MSKDDLLHRKFTQSEDKLLLHLVNTYGDKSWQTISIMMGNRTPRQCRERFKYYLKPIAINREWTQEEDDLLMQKYTELGSKWAYISTFFDGRTDINIKNRFNKLKRQNSRIASSVSDLVFCCPHNKNLGKNISNTKNQSDQKETSTSCSSINSSPSCGPSSASNSSSKSNSSSESSSPVSCGSSDNESNNSKEIRSTVANKKHPIIDFPIPLSILVSNASV